MVSAKGIEDLPDEILLKIFSLLSIQDLLTTIPKVCLLWKALVQAPLLWKYQIYEITEVQTDDEVVEFLRKAPYLRRVSLKRVVGVQVLTEMCHNCRRLSAIDIFYDDNVSQNLLQYFVHQCPDIYHLGVTSSMLSNKAIVATLSRMKSLKVLQITVEKFPEEPICLEPLSSSHLLLEVIRLDMARFESKDLEYLFHQKKYSLKSVSFTLHEGKSLWPLLRDCDGLRELIIYCPFLATPSREDLHSVIRNLRNLVVLHIEGLEYAKSEISTANIDVWTLCGSGTSSDDNTPILDDFLMRSICSSCRLLEDLVLGLRGRSNLTDAGLEVVPRLTRLRKLGLRFCPKLTAAAMDILCKCSNLIELDLTGFPCPRRPPWRGLDRLRVLVLDCSDVTGMPFLELAKCANHLRVLSLDFCEGVDKLLIAKLKAVLPNLQIIYDDSIM